MIKYGFAIRFYFFGLSQLSAVPVPFHLATMKHLIMFVNPFVKL